MTFGGVRVEDTDGATLPSPRPRRLALLLVVGAAGRRGVSRGRLRAIFWPDADEERARHSLSQTIYALRRDVGHQLIVGDGDLRLDSDGITGDVQQFRDAIARGDLTSAYDVYRGPFGAGFVLENTPEFERWLEHEREALCREATVAFEAMAQTATAALDHRRAVDIWRRITSIDPWSGRFAKSYMDALVASGDRAGAIAHAKQYAAQLRAELDADPDPAVSQLADQLRQESRATVATPEPVEAPVSGRPPSEASSPGTTPVKAFPSRRVFPRRVGSAAAVLAAVALVASFFLVRSLNPGARLPVLAVGQIRDLTAPDSARVGGALSEVLATSLARLSGVDVIANSRILELMRPGTDTLRAARTEAARTAGATEIIEGEVLPGPMGQIRLALRRVTVTRGAVRAGYSLSGTDRLALLDSAASLIAGDLKVEAPARSLAEFTPRSPIALRLYEEGLRNFFQSDLFVAQRLFLQALAEDSTFAMAAFYAYRASQLVLKPDTALESLALRLASRATERDRLIILTSIRQAQNEPTAVAYADTLATRFPRDPEALVRATDAILFHKLIGPRERELLERAIAIDSGARASPSAPCRICESLSQLMTAFRWADSGDAAERALRRYAVLRPDDVLPWRELAMQQFYLDRYEKGAELVGKLAGLRPEIPLTVVSPLFVGRLLTGRLDEADAECEVQLHQEDPRFIEGYRWVCVLLWRFQGRYRDVSALVLSGRLPDGTLLKRRAERDFLNEAVLDLDMGRPVLALAGFEAIVPTPDGRTPGWYARELTWSLVHRGTAAAMAGELALVRRLADSAELIGGRSLYGRDPLLHYFLRGLLSAASGDHQSAVDLFRRSIYSPNFGYTRANLEEARSLMALGRPAEAVPVLQAALRGGWDGSNLYVSRTELHELLAQAFAASGSRDSAAAHYRSVERAWRRADPVFLSRYQTARSWAFPGPPERRSEPR